jgi:two-component system cell cycle sensor histidine kinase/response regulator CckA
MSARILIVEDERITAEDLRDTLTELGYCVTAAVSSGVDAIAQAQQNPPDIALMDIHIQGEMDGTAAAMILRQRFNIPVIYLTAHADGETVKRSKEAGPLGYIIKPFQEASLHASIEIALHRHREEQTTRASEKLLSSTLEAISEGVISMDQRSAITLFNPAAEAWTGRSSRDALGMPIEGVFQAFSGAAGDQPVKPWERVLSGGVLQDLPFGAVLISRLGGKQPVSGTVAPIRDHKGEVAGAVLVFGPPSEDAHGDPSVCPPAVQSLAQSVVHSEDGVELGNFKMIAASQP